MPITEYRLQPRFVRWKVLRETDDLRKVHAAQEVAT